MPPWSPLCRAPRRRGRRRARGAEAYSFGRAVAVVPRSPHAVGGAMLCAPLRQQVACGLVREPAATARAPPPTICTPAFAQTLQSAAVSVERVAIMQQDANGASPLRAVGTLLVARRSSWNQRLFGMFQRGLCYDSYGPILATLAVFSLTARSFGAVGARCGVGRSLDGVLVDRLGAEAVSASIGTSVVADARGYPDVELRAGRAGEPFDETGRHRRIAGLARRRIDCRRR